MSTLATGAPGGMTFCIVDKIEATAKTAPKNIFKLSNYQNLYIKFSFCAIKSVVLGQSGSSVSRSIVRHTRLSFLSLLQRHNKHLEKSSHSLYGEEG